MGSTASYNNVPKETRTEVRISKENRLQIFLRNKGTNAMTSREYSDARISAYKAAK